MAKSPRECARAVGWMREIEARGSVPENRDASISSCKRTVNVCKTFDGLGCARWQAGDAKGLRWVGWAGLGDQFIVTFISIRDSVSNALIDDH